MKLEMIANGSRLFGPHKVITKCLFFFVQGDVIPQNVLYNYHK